MFSYIQEPIIKSLKDLKKLDYEEQLELASNSTDEKMLSMLFKIGDQEIKEIVVLNHYTPYDIIEKYFEK